MDIRDTGTDARGKIRTVIWPMIGVCDRAELKLIRLFIDDDDLGSDVWVIVFLRFRDRPHSYKAVLVILRILK
jgi:hypothetical protein